MKLISNHVVFWGDEGDFGVMGWAWEKSSKKKDNYATIENLPARERRLGRKLSVWCEIIGLHTT